MREISTQSIMKTSALLHSAFQSPVPARGETVVSPDPSGNSGDLDRMEEEAEEELPSLIDQVVSSENRVEVVSPFQDPREVRFSGVPDLSLSDDGVFGKGENGICEDVDVLHQQLRNALSDLSAEKAVRSRKEKSLVKLAKELNKRSADAELKERKLIELAETVNALNVSIRQQRADHGADQERHVAVTRESSERGQRLERAVEELRAELCAARRDADGVRAQLAAARSGHRRRLYGTLAAALAAACAGRSAAVANAACAPIFPGTTLLPNHPGTFEAPWWAPTGTKVVAHAIVCPGSVRSKLQWKGDRMFLYNTKDNAFLLQGRGPAGVQVGANQIHFFHHKKGSVENVRAPWAQ